MGQHGRRFRGFGVVLALLAGLGQTLPGGAGGAVAVSDEEAVKGLSAQFGAMKELKTLHARFICEKRLQLLDAPVESAGDVWIRKGDARGSGGAAVRFTTRVPYISEVILADGKVSGRSQHEKTWETKSVGDRPGLTAVMGQLGGWSTGGMEEAQSMYAVTKGEALVPAAPAGMRGQVKGGGAARGAEGLEAYVLTPVNKDLAKAVKSIRLTFEAKSHELAHAEIRTAQDDVTQYWFYEVELNPAVPDEVFKPTGEPGAWSDRARKAAP